MWLMMWAEEESKFACYMAQPQTVFNPVFLAIWKICAIKNKWFYTYFLARVQITLQNVFQQNQAENGGIAITIALIRQMSWLCICSYLAGSFYFKSKFHWNVHVNSNTQVNAIVLIVTKRPNTQITKTRITQFHIKKVLTRSLTYYRPLTRPRQEKAAMIQSCACSGAPS